VVLFLDSDRFRLACCNSRRLGSLAGSETIVIIGVDGLRTTTVLSSSMLRETSSIKPAKNDFKGDDTGGVAVDWSELIVSGERVCLPFFARV
jgi:hypothetical protein